MIFIPQQRPNYYRGVLYISFALLHRPAVLIPGLALKKLRPSGTVLLLPTATEKRAFLFSGFEAVDYKRIEKNSLVLLFIISLLPVGINEQHIFLHLNYLFILVKDRLICFCYFFFGG